MVYFLEQNSDFFLFSIQRPKARFRSEVLFTKFHPRTNLTTLYLTKSCVLNTIKLITNSLKFLDKISKTFTRWEPLGTWILPEFYWKLHQITKLPNKSASDFPILSRSLYGRYPLDSKFWISEYVVIFKMQKCSTKKPSILFSGGICWKNWTN
jgi:hypothetical protein